MGVLGHAFGALLAADFFSSQYGRLEVGLVAEREFEAAVGLHFRHLLLIMFVLKITLKYFSQRSFFFFF